MSQNLTQPEEIDEILKAIAFSVFPFAAPIAEECCSGNNINNTIDDKRATVSG